MLRILVADDHPIVRQGLIRIIEETSDMVVACEAEDGQEVLKKIRENDFDLVILDITMPGKDGIDIMGELRSLRPNLPVLVLTIHPERSYALRMLRAGASGYLTKERAPYELIEAIRSVARGVKYVSTSFAEILTFDSETGKGRPIHQTLSNREFQVMRMIAEGKTVKTIADELSLSVKTVSTHRSRLLTKMNMKNNAEIIHYAINNHLLC